VTRSGDDAPDEEGVRGESGDPGDSNGVFKGLRRGVE
jgi:hypothetical protein